MIDLVLNAAESNSLPSRLGRPYCLYKQFQRLQGAKHPCKHRNAQTTLFSYADVTAECVGLIKTSGGGFVGLQLIVLNCHLGRSQTNTIGTVHRL